MKGLRILFTIIILGWPISGYGIKLKQVPGFCVNMMTALATGDLEGPVEFKRFSTLQNRVDAAVEADLDPVDLARDRVSIFDSIDLKILEQLRPLLRTHLITKHPEYFSRAQLEKMPSESWFTRVDLEASEIIKMQGAVQRQIEKYDEMIKAADIVEASLEAKYSLFFRSENSQIHVDKELNNIKNDALRTANGFVFEFIQNRKNKVINGGDFIQEEIVQFDKVTSRLLQRRLKSKKITGYIESIGLAIEIENAYIEYLFKYYDDQLPSWRFLKLVEQYQRVKRRLIAPILTAINEDPFSVDVIPESWHFYGEILKMTREIALSSIQKERLWEFIQVDIQQVATIAEHGDQYFATIANITAKTGDKGLANQAFHLGLGYDEKREKEKFKAVWEKMWNYSYGG